MARLPALTAKQLLKLLGKAGFVEKRQTGSHIILFHPEKKLVTTVPRHNKTLGLGLTQTIFKQTGLKSDEIRRLLK